MFEGTHVYPNVLVWFGCFVCCLLLLACLLACLSGSTRHCSCQWGTLSLPPWPSAYFLFWDLLSLSCPDWPDLGLPPCHADSELACFSASRVAGLTGPHQQAWLLVTFLKLRREELFPATSEWPRRGCWWPSGALQWSELTWNLRACDDIATQLGLGILCRVMLTFQNSSEFLAWVT